jgi:GNAT superfamily N-acetyltransferase
MASELDFRPVSISSGDGAELVAAMIDEMRRLYCDVGDGLDLDSPNMPKAGPAELGPSGWVYLVGYRDGVAVFGGGIKRLPDGGCAIKRMYVVPAARRQGLARVLLHELENAARGLGYEIARLDTDHVNRTPRGSTKPRAMSRSPTSMATRLRRSSGEAPVGWPHVHRHRRRIG